MDVIWVMTQDGFFSVVEYVPSKDTSRQSNAPVGSLLVRARVRADLESLGAHVPGLEIWQDDSADYMFRTIMTREDWVTCLAGATEEIDYPNFKNRVVTRQGGKRAHVYHRVWSELLALQPHRTGG